jgi:hypothetical protein
MDDHRRRLSPVTVDRLQFESVSQVKRYSEAALDTVAEREELNDAGVELSGSDVLIAFSAPNAHVPLPLNNASALKSTPSFMMN